MDDKTLNDAIKRMIDFMANDKDISKLTQADLIKFMRFVKYALTNYTGSATLQDLKALRKSVPELKTK